MQFAHGTAMRGVYGVIFVGFAVAGFAGVCNVHNSARAETPVADTPTAQSATNPSAPSSITVRTDLVKAEVVRPEQTPAVAQPLRRIAQHSRSRTTRSRFARVVFGDGEFRPQPFPTPAKN